MTAKRLRQGKSAGVRGLRDEAVEIEDEVVIGGGGLGVEAVRVGLDLHLVEERAEGGFLPVVSLAELR